MRRYTSVKSGTSFAMVRDAIREPPMESFVRPVHRYNSSVFLVVSLIVGAALFALSCIGERVASQTSVDKSTIGSNKLGEPAELNDLLSAGLVGSKHDFTQSGDGSRDLCTGCHTPHLPAIKGSAEEFGRIRPYQAIGVELDSASLLCLSCHDGVTASDVFTSAHSTQFARQFGSSQLGGGTLSGHPIGIKYPVSDPTYRSMNAVTTDGRVLLPDGRVQCISCHDPHNTGRHPGMLVRSNSGSKLCLACHRL